MKKAHFTTLLNSPKQLMRRI